MAGRFACPCCGYLTLHEEPPGTFAICAVCNWEDDDLQFAEPNREGGANGPSLEGARRHFAAIGASDPVCARLCRPPRPSDIPPRR